MTDFAVQGDLLFRQGRLEEAIRAWREALRRDPTLAQPYAGLGLACYRLGRPDEAAAAFRGLVRLIPHDAEGHDNLGIALIAAGRFAEAAASCREAVRLRPDDAQYRCNLGVPLYYLDRFADALAAYDGALAIRPDHAGAHGNRGNALFALGRLDEAERAYRAAIASFPGNVEVWTSLGNLLKELGRYEESLAAYRTGQHAAPVHPPAASNLVMALHYAAGITAEQILREAKAVGARFGTARPAMPRQPGGRLRVGYVSGDLRRHPVGYFLAPVLAAHDRSGFEIFCYSANARSDDMTEALRRSADHWRDIVALSDDRAARLIGEDGIDVLVDLSGHTAFNRLPLFARRAAPLQLTWMGFWGTTGVAAIDAILADATMIAPGEERFFSERVVRLPHGRFCYAPPAYAPEPGTRTGAIAFGSFNNLSKVGPAVRLLWAEILRAVPESKLVLKWSSLEDSGLRQRLLAEFAVAPDRIELRGASPHAEMLAQYGDIDIALDPFPFSGGVTTCEALWMGVPVVTLPGEGAASRQTLGFLRAIGRTEWAARSAEDYVRIASGLAADRGRLDEIRMGLRRQVAGSPLCDGQGFTRALEAAYRGLWRDR
jgi:protein O-GlcNAc transferase